MMLEEAKNRIWRE